MPELGGLWELPDIKALVLYLLKEADCVVTETQLTEVMMADGLVEYFDYTQAVDQLLIAGMMDIPSLEETSSYKITKLGLEVVNEYEERLPYNVRSKTLAALKANLRKKREEEETWTEIKRSETGYAVTCTTQEQGEVLLSYTILVPEQRDAYYAAQRFKENPAFYYQRIMELVLDENLFKKPE